MQKQYVDAAADFGFEYTLVDANWNLWQDAAAKVGRERVLLNIIDRSREGA